MGTVEIDKELNKFRLLLDELIKDYICDYLSQENYENFKRKHLYEINKLNLEKGKSQKKKLIHTT